MVEGRICVMMGELVGFVVQAAHREAEAVKNGCLKIGETSGAAFWRVPVVWPLLFLCVRDERTTACI